MDNLDTNFIQITSYIYEESETVIKLLNEYFKIPYIAEECVGKGYNFYVKCNSPEEATAIDKQIQKSLKGCTTVD